VTPPAATLSARRESARRAARRRNAARRRRAFLSVVGVAALIVLVIVAMPLFRKAVNEFNLPLQYQDIIRQQASEKHLDPAFIAAVIYAETKFDARTSPAGAQGLMQIEPSTAQFLARKSGATTFTTADLATPQVNIAYGSYYLRYLLNEYGQSKIEALAAYNGGESNVNDWVARARAHRHVFAISDIPFPETQAYVAKVLRAQRDYRKTYPAELGYR
jgi:soluble lytic murein transglycosylase